MTQQIPLLSKLRKGFLIVGVVLLILGFFFFYWASSVSLEYVTTYKNEVNLNSPQGVGSLFDEPEPVEYYYYLVIPHSIDLQPDDFLNVSYAPNLAKGNVYIKLDETPTLCISEGQLSFKNYYLYDIRVWVYLVTSNGPQNVTISATTQLTHYERPQWVYFGIGVVLCSLAMIPIFKSKKS